MKLLLKVFKFFFLTIFFPFWQVQVFIKRNPDVWLFGAWYGENYSDNSRSLFEHISENDPNLKVFWVTKDKQTFSQLKNNNIPVLYYLSLKCIFYSLRASVVIVSSGKQDVNELFINGAKVINCWHGAPMKKIDQNKEKSNSIKNKIIKTLFPYLWEPSATHVVSTAKVFDEILANAFNISVERVLLTGYPRNDVFYSSLSYNTHHLIKEINKKYDNPFKAIYLPTYNTKSNINKFIDYQFDFNSWTDFLLKKNMVLMIKSHYAENSNIISFGDERIIVIDDSINGNINKLLKDVDILITDYSGAYFDFLLTGKPIILSCFDLDEYKIDPGFNFDYENKIKGYRCENWQEIQPLLNKISKLIPPPKDTVKYFNKFTDSSNSLRLTQAIKNL